MWRNMISAVILTAMAVGVSWAVLPPDGWRDTVQVAGDQGVVEQFCRLAVDGANIHVIWSYDGLEKELWYRWSTDAGFTFGPTVQISRAAQQGMAVYPPDQIDIAYAPYGRLLAVWSQAYPMQGICYWSYSSDYGNTWSSPQVVPGARGVGHDVQPSLCVDHSGLFHLVFRSLLIGHSWSELVYCTFDGSQWSPLEAITNVTTTRPRLCIRNDQPHVVWESLDPVVCLTHAVKTTSRWEISDITDSYNCRSHDFYANNVNEWLHVVARWYDNALYYFRSEDGGVTWSRQLLETGGQYLRPMSVAGDATGLHVVFSKDAGNTSNLFYYRSTDYGTTWPSLAEQVTDLNGHEYNQDMAYGRFGRVVVFNSHYFGLSPYSYVYCTANDDTLLSDSPEATAFTSGRHLVRDPMTNRLHLVYFSQDRPHYTYSDDEGSHWAPYHIMDNIGQSGKDRGKFSSMGLYASPSETFEPYVVYASPASTGDTLKYRWWNPATNAWQGFWLCNAGILLSAPSVTTFGEMIGVVVVAKNHALGQYVVCYYEFPYYAAGPGTPEIVQSGFQDTYASPCITVDGNWDKHAVYEENGEIIYERRVGPNTWVRDPPFPATPEWSVTPFVEFYGDKLYVPYAEEDHQPLGYYDVYRRWRDLPLPLPWSDAFPVSRSGGIPSQCPVAAWGDFTVWAEQAPGDIEFDVKYYWHPEYQSGFVWMYPLHSDHLHTQMYYDWLGGSTVLLTAWTEGLMTAAPYRIAFRKMSFLPPPGDFGTYYAVSTGNPTPSFFCSKRDSFVRYQRYKVDFGKDELAYTLTLLNPTYPAYRVKVMSYFEGIGNRTEKVLIDGKEYTTLDLKPNQLNTTELLIPKEYYKGDHKVVVTFRGSQVTKAGLVVQQLEQAKVGGYAGGGVQSVSTEKLIADDIFTVSPNPAKGLVTITYSLVHPGDIKLRLYDVSGRMIQELAQRLESAGTHQVALKQGLPAGIYFVAFEIDGKRIIRKVTIIR